MSTWLGTFALVYSYNRKELAAQCLDSLARQTVQPERIIFVDNGSTDGTRDHLKSLGILDDPRIEYVRIEQNTGASGGLRTGMTHAYRAGCAWVWVMDDDVICEPDTLAELKRAYEDNFSRPEEVGFLVSQLINPDGRANNTPQIDDRTEGPDRCPEWAHLLARGLIRVRISTLTSVIVPRSTMRRFGVPSPDFFLWGEDTDWTMRVTDTLPSYMVGPSRAVHLRGVGGFLSIFTENDPARIRNFFYLYRNTVYLRRRFWPPHGLFLFLAKAVLHFGQSFLQPRHRWLRARMILGGTLAGLAFHPHPALLESDTTPPPAREGPSLTPVPRQG